MGKTAGSNIILLARIPLPRKRRQFGKNISKTRSSRIEKKGMKRKIKAKKKHPNRGGWGGWFVVGKSCGEMKELGNGRGNERY